jgi:hypothetical protein
MPSSSEPEERIIGLVAVEDTDLEVLAILCEGAYTVDWGDGSAPEDVASGAQAEHTYVYADIATDPLSYGYKTVIVTVTPQAGSNLTLAKLNEAHSLISGSFGPINKWLDLDISVPFCAGWAGYDLDVSYLTWMEHCIIREHALISMAYLFDGCTTLMSIELPDNADVEDTSFMFASCYRLPSIPLFGTPNVTDATWMFQNCFSLLCVPELDTSNVTLMSGVFEWCMSLECAPKFNTSKVTRMAGMFSNCYSLLCVPPYETSKVTSFWGTFSLCTRLGDVPNLDTGAALDFNSFFALCYSLTRVPAFDSATVTTARSMFSACNSLSIIPSLNLSGISSALRATRFIDGGCRLSRSLEYGRKYGPQMDGGFVAGQYGGQALSAGALNEIFTNLGTAVGTQYIIITRAYGAADPVCNRTIATNKGWTVIG